MADPNAGAAASAGTADHGRGGARKILVSMVVVLVFQALFALCLVSALQTLTLRNAPQP